MVEVVDLSFAWPSMTGELLAARGVTHVIGYVSPDPAKNVSRARFQDWLAHGLAVALVCEHVTNDDQQGPANGDYLGQLAIEQADALGYDWRNCVLFKAADRNVLPEQLPAMGANLAAFGRHVPHPGLYGNLRSLAYAQREKLAEVFWQSDSQSFSDYQIYAGAHLVQVFNDPRVAGLPVDLNLYRPQPTPLRFMGDTRMSNNLTADDLNTIKLEIRAELAAARPGIVAEIVNNCIKHADNQNLLRLLIREENNSQTTSLRASDAGDVAAISAAISEHLPAGSSADADTIARAVLAHFAALAEQAASTPQPPAPASADEPAAPVAKHAAEPAAATVAGVQPHSA